MLSMRKKALAVGLVTSALLLTACSDNAENVNGEEGADSLAKSLKPLESSANPFEGVWGFCNDKKATITTAEDSCQTIDASIWHMADGELTALDVTNTATEGCTSTCFNLNNEVVKTKVIAKGYYEIDENGYSFTITESLDEKRFPVCTVNWNLGTKLADDLVQWKFKNVDCELPAINYSAWARKYVGEVN